MDNDACMFVTTFYGIYHIQTGLVECANAGHTPPYLLKADGTMTMITRNEGIPLGIMHPYSYIRYQFALDKGDCLILYTDGMIEACNSQNETYGEERFAHSIREWTSGPLPTLTTHLLVRLAQFTQGTPSFDDEALTLFETIVNSCKIQSYPHLAFWFLTIPIVLQRKKNLD